MDKCRKFPLWKRENKPCAWDSRRDIFHIPVFFIHSFLPVSSHASPPVYVTSALHQPTATTLSLFTFLSPPLCPSTCPFSFFLQHVPSFPDPSFPPPPTLFELSNRFLPPTTRSSSISYTAIYCPKFLQLLPFPTFSPSMHLPHFPLIST